MMNEGPLFTVYPYNPQDNVLTRMGIVESKQVRYQPKKPNRATEHRFS